MKCSAETRRALQRYGHVGPIVGLGGTCAGIATAFRFIGIGSTSEAVVLGLSLSVAMGVTVLLAVLAVAGCLLFERVRSRRAA